MPSSPFRPSANGENTRTRQTGAGSGCRPLRGHSAIVRQGVAIEPIGVTVKVWVMPRV